MSASLLPDLPAEPECLVIQTPFPTTPELSGSYAPSKVGSIGALVSAERTIVALIAVLIVANELSPEVASVSMLRKSVVSIDCAPFGPAEPISSLS
ncbi:MAG: hypothetical protein ACD_39C02072G0001 [uncultured bacterium]|nr:MAG: hypothetical protein ACD_39C02072G0001 [uncultured bacterium]